MATLSRGDSRRLYSWWWDSHISPKNSKWLQENLTEMDFKVKTMVKLVEEDADSFTRRAEMYYKKRPELMKLVEEFYRAYRALAERYDHAKGALRQAHKSMSEAFPNEVPSFDEGSPAPSLCGDTQPNSPTMSPRRLSVDTKQEEVLVSPARSDTTKTSAATSDDSETLIGKKGSKKFNEILSKFSGNTAKTDSGSEKEGKKEPPSKFSWNKAKKDSDNGKEDKKEPPSKFSWNKAKKDSDTEKDKKEPLRDKSNSRDRPRQKEDEGAVQKAQKLEEEISRLSAENKILKSQVKTESKTSTSAESELQWLRKAFAKLEPEKEEALAQFQQSLKRVRALEAEIEKFKKQNAELEADINKVEGNQGKAILFEKRKQSLELETSKLKQKNKDQQDEISRKQKELDQLKVSMEDEHMRCLHVEAALESLKKLHSQSEEALRVSQLEIKDKVKLLRQTEVKKQSLEKELKRVSEELTNVDRQTTTSRSTIKGLQDEISRLKEAKEKLECEAQQYIDGKRALDEELCALKQEIDDLKRAHKSITDQIKGVGLNEESLQSSVKELQDDSSELRDICKRKEEENALLMEKLERLQELSSQSSLLEISLSEANIELDGLREKIEVLEESCKTLQVANSSLESEKNELVSKLGIVANKVEELSEKNALLEDSLSEAVAEVEELRQSLKNLDESCQSLQEDKSNLQAEKNTLLSKVELMGHNLEDLTRRFAELNGKHSYLEKESNLKDVQLAELQDLFRMKKQQYEAYTDYSNARVTSLEDQIRRLNEGGKSKDEELEDEHLRVLATEMEIFILEASLSNLNERNLNLSREWHRMEQYICEQQKKEDTLMDQIGLLRKELHGIWSTLNNNEQLKMAEGSEELIFQLVLGKIKEMQHSIDTMKDERKGLLNEKSVLVSLLQELGHQMSDLRSDRGSFYDDHRSKSEALSSLKGENRGLIDNNEKLKKDSEVVRHREEKLEDEKKSLSQQVLEMKHAQLRSQAENFKLLEENELLLTKLSELRDEIHTLEDEYAAVFLKTTVLDTLSSIFEKFKDERIIDPKILDDELMFSRNVSNNFEKALGEIAETSNTAESGRSRLRTLAMKLEGCRDQLTVLAVDMSMAKTVNEELNEQIEQLNQLLECRKKLLEQKDTKQLEADEQVKVLLEQNAMLHGNIEGIKLEFSEVKSMRDELERKITTLLAIMPNKDTRHAHEENKMPNKESVLDEHNEELRMKRQEMTLSLLNEMSSCEEEVAALCAELQTANVRAAIFEEKVLELMQVCESLEVRNLAEREAFNEKLNSKDAFILELNAKLEGLEGANGPMKAQLREYMNVVSSLGQSISSLEDLILPFGNRSEVQNDYMVRVARKRGNLGRRDGPSGILQLQKLLAKVEVLREVLVESGGSRVGIRPGRIVATTESKPSTSREEDLMMKDIELDHVSDSSKFDLESSLYSTLDGDTIGNDDRMPELWEVPKSSRDFFEDWNKEVIGRLSSDAKKLVDLKTSADELKIKMEKSDGDNLPKGFEYDTVKMQLQSAEENILKLVETNKRLIKKAESISAPPVGNIDGINEANLRRKTQVTLRVRRGSDKIGRLELELQKLEYILLKIEEDCENHRKEAAKAVPLKDYLYGKKERRRKRDHFCGCFGSKEPAVNE